MKQMLDRKVAYPTIDTVEPERAAIIISPRERGHVRSFILFVSSSFILACLMLFYSHYVCHKYLVEYT